MRGVHAELGEIHSSGEFGDIKNSLIREFAKIVPSKAEVVVKYEPLMRLGGGGTENVHKADSACGIALILRPLSN